MPTPAPASNPDDETELVLAVMRAQEAAGNAFESTGVQLSRLVWMLEDSTEPLAAEKAAEEWHAEVFRRLITFLNAAHDMLVYARQMAELSGAPAAPAAAPPSAFLTEIRTCMQHRRTPPMRLTQYDPPAPRLRVLHMDITEMLCWPHWSPSARQYLHQHQHSGVAVQTMVHEHLQSLRIFRQRTLREFRAKFAVILAACPAPLPMMMIPGM